MNDQVYNITKKGKLLVSQVNNFDCKTDCSFVWNKPVPPLPRSVVPNVSAATNWTSGVEFLFVLSHSSTVKEGQAYEPLGLKLKRYDVCHLRVVQVITSRWLGDMRI